jgi:ubiquinone/menaquinone biosynthesis C-methylase UbiE
MPRRIKREGHRFMAIHQFDEREAVRLDKQYAIPVIVEQRRRTLEALSACRGERILDIGSGPAFLTADLARLVGPGGRVCAVDASDAMLEVGRRRCASFPTVEFKRGDARNLPYPDGAFDAAVAVQVYLYVPELDAALAELHRVVRPGGRAVVMDTDWGSSVWRSRDPARMARVLEVWKQRYSNGLVGRVLPAALRRAGFTIAQATAVPIVELTATEDDYSGGQLREIAKYVADQRGAVAAEVQAWKSELLALADSGDYFFSLNRYLFVARRPA